MKVSVIIAVYNCELYIKECIESILNQTYTDLEVLVCDDKSADTTNEVLRQVCQSDERIKVWENETNQGVVFTRNFLINQATGDLIAIQDADDWSHPERIERQVNSFKENPNLIACCTQMVKTNNEGDVLFKSNFDLDYDTIKRKLPNEFEWQSATLMAKKDILQQLGLYSEYYNRIGNEDLYLIALLTLTGEIINLPGHLYFYRYNEASLTKSLVDTRQLVIHAMTKELLTQYIEKQTNWLENNDLDAIHTFEEQLLQPYKSDKTLVYREFSGRSMYWNDYKQAFNFAFKAWIRQPFNFENIKLIGYLCKKRVLK